MRRSAIGSGEIRLPLVHEKRDFPDDPEANRLLARSMRSPWTI